MESAPCSAPTFRLTLVRILQILGEFYHDPKLGIEGMHEKVDWVSRELHLMTGLPYRDIFDACDRLGLGEKMVLDGVIPGSAVETLRIVCICPIGPPAPMTTMFS